ncbi:anti-sigma factor [Paenibacillus antarcticus]|uniref:Anti-sigma-W factor RsiW n=1 Tax=Paenibacillus antarcticus TaxID=253703 RepID=A0A168NFH5_9BACL|nr:anti-sigma factor [Paenibacillus antarcticus]OAB45743.1 hypothetical protein PBAT_12610 [Paenibacillus antarcticus]
MNERANECCDWADMYVLGGLDAVDTVEFEAHLQTCVACQDQVQELREVVDLLPLAVEEVQPPEGMRTRILSHVLNTSKVSEDKVDASDEEHNVVEQTSNRKHGEDIQNLANEVLQVGKEVLQVEPTLSDRGGMVSAQAVETPSGSWIPARRNTRRSSLLLWRTVSVGLAAAVAGLAIYTSQLQRDVNGLTNQLTTMNQPAQGLRTNEAVQLNPQAKDIVAKGLATIVIDDKGTHLVVQAEKLPELTGNQAFQVWLIKGDVKQNAGTFLANSKGTGAVYYSFDPDEYDTVAITLEPDAMGQQPRGQIILAAPIKES